MPQTAEVGKELGSHVRRRRVLLGIPNTDALAERMSVSPNLLQAIEEGVLAPEHKEGATQVIQRLGFEQRSEKYLLGLIARQFPDNKPLTRN